MMEMPPLPKKHWKDDPARRAAEGQGRALTQERLKELLSYDETTGIFTARVTRGRVKAGDPAGGKRLLGYHAIGLDYHLHPTQRLAWLYVHGKWPEGYVDHINGNPGDNRICNLRDVTPTVNAQNRRKPHENNKSGFLGVWKHAGNYRAKIFVDGKHVDLGRYETPEEAHAVYVEAKRKQHEGCSI